MSEFFLCEIENIAKSGVEIKVTGTRIKKDDDDCIRAVRTVCFDFSEHDKVFKDKIEELDRMRKTWIDNAVKWQRENEKLKKQIAELEGKNNRLTESILRKETKIHELASKGTEKPTKVNLNDRIKVKLTPLGAEIYYNRYDFLKSSIRAIGGVCTEPKMPKIDENGYTEMTMWQFIELYGKDIGKINREVIKPLDIIITE